MSEEFNTVDLNIEIAKLRGEPLYCKAVHDRDCSKRCPTCDYNVNPKPYSTDLNLAHELVEEWKADSGVAQLSWSKEEGWRVVWDMCEAAVCGDTLADAICRAYLEWKKHTKQES